MKILIFSENMSQVRTDGLISEIRQKMDSQFKNDVSLIRLLALMTHMIWRDSDQLKNCKPKHDVITIIVHV